MTAPSEVERLRGEVLDECADIVEVQGNGTRRYLGPRVAPVNAKLDALLAAAREEAVRWCYANPARYKFPPLENDAAWPAWPVLESEAAYLARATHALTGRP